MLAERRRKPSILIGMLKGDDEQVMPNVDEVD
jgi:hypothetical protein